jgi:glycosyltransferase 2 family protein
VRLRIAPNARLPHMKWRFALFAALGVALALYLVMFVGWRAVLSTAIAIGWGGFALFCLCSLGVFLVLGAAWRVLLPEASASGAWVFVRARMVRDSAAEVLPFSQLGGIALGVRAAILHGVPSPLACASMIVDVTTELLAQIAYVALGIALLTTRAPRNSLATSLTSTLVAVMVLAAVAAGLFLAVQRYAPKITNKLAARLLRSMGPTITEIGTALDAIYRAPARVALSVALHFAAWIASAAAAWLGFVLIGAHLDLGAVIAIESLVYAIRSVAVLIPNALGVQEAVYALLVPLFGVGMELGLALSVLKRARDIAIGVPVLLMWQTAEGRSSLAREGLRKP